MNAIARFRSLGRRTRSFVRNLTAPVDATAARYRRAYDRTTIWLAQTDTWSAAQQAQNQLRMVNELLRRAQVQVPGHARAFAAAGIRHVRPLECLGDLARFPFQTKEDLRTAPEDFVARDVPQTEIDWLTSGGTTGTPTRFAVERGTYDALFDAWRHAMWRRVGFAPGVRALDLTWAFEGDAAHLRAADGGRQHLSINHLEPSLVARWLPAVRALQPQFIIGFPSTVAALAKLAGGDEGFARVQALLLASEALLPGQRAELERVFRARVFCWYGMSELAGFASGCEHADTYHFWPQAGVVELIDATGNAVQGVGSEGEIVLTSFLNRATPLIRFRTGDRGVYGEPCPHCRRPHVVLAKIEGRTQDFLLAANGRRVPLSALNFHTAEFRRVLAHQFNQTEPGQVTLNLVTLEGYSENDRLGIETLVAGRLGPDIDLKIAVVPQLSRTARGKSPIIVRHGQAANPAAPP